MQNLYENYSTKGYRFGDKFCMNLQNVAPTSCASERASSNSNNFVNKKILSDKNLDNLCFLYEIFKEN